MTQTDRTTDTPACEPLYAVVVATKDGVNGDDLLLRDTTFVRGFEQALQDAEDRVIGVLQEDVSDEATLQDLEDQVRSSFADARDTGDGWSETWSSSGGEAQTTLILSPYEVAVSVTRVPDL